MKLWDKGFTLVEVLVAAAILVGVLLAILGLFFSYFVLMETSRNNTIAVNDARLILENIRDTEPFTSVTTRYPEEEDLAEEFGCDKLKNETIFVDYADPGADPLEITVTVNWQERTTRDRSLNIVTLMTQR